MKRVLLGIMVSLPLFLTNCKNTVKNPDEIEGESLVDTSSAATINEQAEFQFDITISNIPAPFNLMESIATAGIGINKTLLNPLSNLAKYTTTNQKALAFGIYNIDLGYLSVYNQNQDVINYFVEVRKLAKDLGAGSYFDEISGSVKLDESIGNKEQMITVLDKAYTASDKYLKSNQRLVAATLMLVGGWLESQYIALNSLKNVEKSAKTEALYRKIWDQRSHMANIIKLLDELKKDEGILPIYEGMSQIEPLYKELSEEGDVDMKKIKEMAEKVSEVRNKLVG